MPTQEFVIPALLFPTPPVVGSVYTNAARPLSALIITSFRKQIGGPRGPAYRIVCTRTRIADLPADVTVLPWPTQKVVKPPLPTAEMFVGPPPAPPKIVTLEAGRIATRKKILNQKRADLLADQHAVPGHQVASSKVVPHRHRDIEDLNPNRRVARQVDGFRNATDPIEHLLGQGSLTKKHGFAVRKLRKYFELGAISAVNGPVWDAVHAGFGPTDGPSMTKLENLRAYNQAQTAMGRLFDVLLNVCLVGETLTAYALRTGLNRQIVCGRLQASADCLVDYFERLADEAKAQAAQ